jgi:hypothetical protein
MSVENLTPDEELIHRLGGQIKRLQEQLCIATKALEEIEKNATRKDIQTITVLCVNNWLLAHKALKEIDLVGISRKEEV